MDSTLETELQEIVGEQIKIYSYNGTKFPIGIFRKESSFEYEGRKIMMTPRNSLIIMPPKYQSFSAHFHALVFAEWESMTYHVWIRRFLIGNGGDRAKTFAELQLALAYASEQLLHALKFGGETEDNSKELVELFDNLDYMPVEDWDNYR